MIEDFRQDYNRCLTAPSARDDDPRGVQDGLVDRDDAAPASAGRRSL